MSVWAPRQLDLVVKTCTHNSTCPSHVAELASRLGLEAGAYSALHELLDDLAYDGGVVALPGQRFRLNRRQVEQRGAPASGYLNVNPRGFGFVSAQAFADDIFIPPESMKGALHGDLVGVRIPPRRPRRSATGYPRRRSSDGWTSPALPLRRHAAAEGRRGDRTPSLCVVSEVAHGPGRGVDRRARGRRGGALGARRGHGAVQGDVRRGEGRAPCLLSVVTSCAAHVPVK